MLRIAVVLLYLGAALGGVPRFRAHVPILDGRIIGGKDADIANYPYQAALVDEEDFYFCGSTIISSGWVATAGHCVLDEEAENIFVRAGSSRSESGGQLVGVTAIVTHPNFSFNLDYDIALLQLAENITVANFLPVTLPKADDPIPDGAVATVSGWGTVANGSYAVSLQVVEVPVVSQDECEKIYDTVTDRMFCAGYVKEGGKDACTGDSGGPVIVEGVYTGVVSWGRGCAEPKYPGVYTNVRVAAIRNWITEITGV